MNSSASESNGRDIHLLSIEGRGITGLTALFTLKEVLQQYQSLQKSPQLPRPCDVFELAGGSGTGGLIVIMLFRLRMSIDEAIAAFIRIFEDVFSPKIPHSSKTSYASRMEDAVEKVICSCLSLERGQGHQIPMLDNQGSKCFVNASNTKNLSFPTLFRTYIPPRNASYNCTIVEAIRATTAEKRFFPSIDIGDVNIKETFIYVGSLLNNPLKAVLEEAVSIFPGQRISCVLSIGSGLQDMTGFETTSTSGLVKVLMNDSERISEEVAKALFGSAFYCRLNVDYGLQNIRFDDWKKRGDVETHTKTYLQKHRVNREVDLLVQILNQRTAVSNAVTKTLRALGKYLDGLSSILPGESWSKMVFKFIQILKEPSKIATEILNKECALLRDTLRSCIRGMDVGVLPNELRENIGWLLKELKKAFEDILGCTHEDPLTSINMDIRRLVQLFWFQNHIAGNIMIHDILKYIQKDDSARKSFTRLEQHAMSQNLASLNVAQSAAYDSSEASKRVSCFKGTRVNLLNEIASWVTSDDPNLPPIYVLDGVAGIGKSTIAQTIAEHTAGINALGASFFFSRNDDKRKTVKTFFPTIAYQLAYYSKEFADQIDDALFRTPHAVAQLPQKQFSALIMGPLKASFSTVGNPILIVIDALDECEDDGDVLLKIFADSIRNMPRLKLFITMRPERHLRIVLDRYRYLKRFHLQDIEQSVVQSDIRLYLDFHLSETRVKEKLPELDCTWKFSEKDMGLLVGMCGTLFILASTAVKFILDNKRSDPAKQLSRLLLSGSKHTKAMDSFYTQILLSALPDDEDEDEDDRWLERYQIVVGTIIALQYPLPCRALSALTGLIPNDVTRTLFDLHSLVAPTGQYTTFRIHHKTFPEFVTSPERCKQDFLIDLTARHLRLGKQCLKIMESHLNPNIFNLDSTDRFKDNCNTQHLIQDHILDELAYASTYWATHLSRASILDAEANQLLECFACKHLLVWLEVLSFIGEVESAYSSLDKIGKLLIKSKSTAGITRGIFHDACRFIASNIEIIKVSAGHVLSAFAFVPRDTKLFQTYGGLKGISFEVISGHEKEWSPTISVMMEHTGNVNYVTFSGDGSKLATASDDRTVRLWDAQTGAELAVLRGHLGSVGSVIFSPDGTKLASASSDRTVRLWDGQTGTERAVLRGYLKWVNSLAFSPDGLKLASGSGDGAVRLWNVDTTCEEAIVLHGHSDVVNSVIFSSDSTTLASAADDETVRLWNGKTGAQITVLRGHSECVHSAVFSPDGKTLASASDDKTLRLWDGRTGAPITVLRGHLKWVNSVAFSPDGTKLASSSADGTVRLWDRYTGAELRILKGHSSWVKSVVFSSDGRRLASASDDRTVRLWDSQTGAELAVLRGHSYWVRSVAFSPDGAKLASASDDFTARLWDGQTNTETTVLPGLVNSLSFSPDGSDLASASHDGTVRLWDCETGDELCVLRGHTNWVKSVVFSPDGRKIVSASADGTVRVWDARTGAEIAVVEKHTEWVNSVVFSPDGRTLASAYEDGSMRLWDGRTITPIAVLQGHSAVVNSIVFSTNGTKLASASDDKTVRLWDGETGIEIRVLRGHSRRVRTVLFSPDGKRLASASAKTVCLWDSQTGDQVASFPALGFTFTLDGTRMLSLNAEEIFQVDCMTGRKLAAVVPATFTCADIQGVRVPGTNLWAFLVLRKQPLLAGLSVVKVDEKGELAFVCLCWFPSNLSVFRLAASSCSQVAVGCRDGHVLLLDISRTADDDVTAKRPFSKTVVRTRFRSDGSQPFKNLFEQVCMSMAFLTRFVRIGVYGFFLALICLPFIHA